MSFKSKSRPTLTVGAANLCKSFAASDNAGNSHNTIVCRPLAQFVGVV